MKKSNSMYPLHRVNIKVVTWSRDSHGLYDYESRSVHKRLIQAPGPLCIIRSGTDVQSISTLSEMNSMPGFNMLCSLDQEKSDFFIKPHDSEPLWQVVRSMKCQYGSGCILKEGDIIKLGRVSFKISSLQALDDKSSGDNTQDSEDIDCDIPNERETGVCKVCLYEDSDPNNPLISPCKCSGSMKYVHLLCLQKWLASRMVSRNTENCITYSWKSMECEICKCPYPFSFCNKGRETDLFSLERPEVPYLVLEAIAGDRNNNRAIHIISVTSKNSVKLGRGHDSDVRISDISVSRCHAIIKLRDGNFLLEDNNSKFGTLVMSKDKVHIPNNYSVVVQTGRTVITMSLKSSASPFDLGAELDNSLDDESIPIGKRSL